MAKKKEQTIVKEKTYSIKLITYEDGSGHLIRENDGFSPLELLGYLEHAQLEIMQELAGVLKPDVVERKFVKPSKTN